MTGDAYVLVGGSRGIGLETAKHFFAKGHRVFSVSRTLAPHGEWIQADVATDEGIREVTARVGDTPLRGLLYLGGVWESGAFTSSYDFRTSSTEEIRRVITVNLIAPIMLAQALLPNLIRSGNGRIIAIGAFSGLAGRAGREVANSASKTGLVGAIQALNLSLRPHGVSATVISPDNVGTPEVLSDIASGSFSNQRPIPITDVVRTVEFVLSLSADSVPVEINMAQLQP